MNQGKLDVFKQEMASVNANILGKWMGKDEFNSGDHCIYYSGQISLRRNVIALTVHKRVQNVLLVCNLENNRMTSVCFQGKPFNITLT